MDKRKVEESLKRKGFRQDDRHHHMFVYHTRSGLKTPIRTRTSHGSKPKRLSAPLVSAMAKQTKLTTEQFRELVECPLDAATYEKILHDMGAI